RYVHFPAHHDGSGMVSSLRFSLDRARPRTGGTSRVLRISRRVSRHGRPHVARLARTLMLAWIFWHTRLPEVIEDDYVDALRAFHIRIADAKPDGFLGVRTLRYDTVPWLVSPAEVYEDWYFVRDCAALDVLDEA